MTDRKKKNKRNSRFLSGKNESQKTMEQHLSVVHSCTRARTHTCTHAHTCTRTHTHMHAHTQLLPWMLHPLKKSFKNKGEIEMFSHIQKLKIYITSRPALQEISKAK